MLIAILFQILRPVKAVKPWIVVTISSFRLKRYFRENPGDPFIMGFQTLLVACAYLLVQGNSELANDVAVYAYYLLVIGIVLQLVMFIREEHKHTSVSNGKAC
ncbi:MAG: hypothetical protein ACUVUS_10495 [Thermoproteota archaeon]